MFDANIASPLSSLLSVESGQFAISDTDGRLSIAASELIIAADTNNATMQAGTHTHQAGMALYIKAQRSLGTVAAGFGASNVLVAGLRGNTLRTLADISTRLNCEPHRLSTTPYCSCAAFKSWSLIDR